MRQDKRFLWSQNVAFWASACTTDLFGLPFVLERFLTKSIKNRGNITLQFSAESKLHRYWSFLYVIYRNKILHQMNT